MSIIILKLANIDTSRSMARLVEKYDPYLDFIIQQSSSTDYFVCSHA